MGRSRRDFLKASTIGAPPLTLLGLEPTPAQAQLASSRSPVPHGPVNLPILFGELRCSSFTRSATKLKNVTRKSSMSKAIRSSINAATLCPKALPLSRTS